MSSQPDNEIIHVVWTEEDVLDYIAYTLGIEGDNLDTAMEIVRDRRSWLNERASDGFLGAIDSLLDNLTS